MVVLAFLTDPPVVRRIFDHLHLPSVPPLVAPPRCPFDGQQGFFDDPGFAPDPSSPTAFRPRGRTPASLPAPSPRTLAPTLLGRSTTR